jgi:hypothetical protein
MDLSPGLQQILADLAAAHGALRRSSSAFDTAVAGMHGAIDGMHGAIDGMRGALDGIAAANHAQGDAIDAIVAATEKALRLFTSTERH